MKKKRKKISFEIRLNAVQLRKFPYWEHTITASLLIGCRVRKGRIIMPGLGEVDSDLPTVDGSINTASLNGMSGLGYFRPDKVGKVDNWGKKPPKKGTQGEAEIFPSHQQIKALGRKNPPILRKVRVRNGRADFSGWGALDVPVDGVDNGVVMRDVMLMRSDGKFRITFVR